MKILLRLGGSYALHSWSVKNFVRIAEAPAGEVGRVASAVEDGPGIMPRQREALELAGEMRADPGGCARARSCRLCYPRSLGLCVQGVGKYARALGDGRDYMWSAMRYGEAEGRREVGDCVWQPRALLRQHGAAHTK